MSAAKTLSSNPAAYKRGWDERWEEFSNWAEKGKAYQTELMKLVDEDTNAFNRIMDIQKDKVHPAPMILLQS